MQIYISITNSECQVQSSTSSIDKLLKDTLSYKDQNVGYSIVKAKRKVKQLTDILENGSSFSFDASEINKELNILNRNIRYLEKQLFIRLYDSGKFATGLLPRAIKALEQEGHEVILTDKRVKPQTKKYRFVLSEPLHPLRYYQKEAVKSLEHEGRGIIVAATGTGKTQTILKMIWDLGVDTLIITPSKEITNMMVTTLVNHFGKGKVEKLTTKTAKIKKPINVINIQALIKLDPKVLEGISAVFIDEFHHSGADTYREANLKHLKNCYFRIGVTATNFRTDGSDLALESVLSNVLYNYPAKKAIKEGYLVQPQFEILETEASIERKYQDSYKTNIVHNDSRNNLIAEIAEAHCEDHVIILVKEVEHGNNLKTLIPNSEFITGKEKDVIRQRLLDDFKSGKIKCLIGTSVIGEGVDLPIADVLIMAGGGKSKIQIMQNVGRVLRLFKNKTTALVYDFTDYGCKWLSAHSKERQLIYEEYLP